MVKFGIEIRRAGNVKNLYRDVDKVLAKYRIQPNGVSADCVVETVGHALHKMIKQNNWFDVCTITSLEKLCGLNIDSKRIAMYRSIHCMHWNEMLPEYRQMVIAMIFDDFRSILNNEEINVIE